MEKIIVEVGSTCTKVDKFNGKNIEKLEGKTIQFKKHYNEDKKLRESDVNKLIENIKELKNISKDIYVCGTSIFRQLRENEKEELRDLSIVTFRHSVGNKDFGTIGIIGPKRMDYSKVISVMKYISKKLNEKFEDEDK